MKISAAIPTLDLASAPTSAPLDAAAGRGFETAVRAVAEKAGDRGGAPAGNPPPAPERASDGRKDAAASSPHHASKSKADEEVAKDDKALPAAVAPADAPATPTADLLGRLLAGTGHVPGVQAGKAGKGANEASSDETGAKLSVLSDADAAALAATAAAAAAAGTTFDGALEERLVITPLGAGGGEGKVDGAAKGRAGVGLEVLHMETHFEPRVDDLVLVEGAPRATGTAEAKAGAENALGGVLSTIRLAAVPAKGSTERGRGGEDGGVVMRFDETLARLANGEVAADAYSDASDRRGARDRHADAKVTDDARQSASRLRSDTTVEIETSATTLVPSSMTSQIADRIVDAFRPSTGQERSPDTAPGETHLRMTAGGAALKTLTIQLQPENLGKLEVSMRLVEGRLTLELAASSAETAVALAHDRAGLKKLLEHAGFSMDEASISIVARDSTAALARSGASPDAGGQGQSASSGDGQGRSDASSSGERGFTRDSGSNGRDPSPGRRDRGEDEPRAPVRQRSSVFL